jgi:hypothetical protein
VEVRAAQCISAEPEDVYAFLRTLGNHVELMRGAAEPGSVHDDGAVLRLQGPLGIRRHVQTRLTYTSDPDSIVGTAQAGAATRGIVTWTISPADGGSRVEVAARAETLGRLDRLLLLAGGRRWLARSLRVALERLERSLCDAAHTVGYSSVR